MGAACDEVEFRHYEVFVLIRAVVGLAPISKYVTHDSSSRWAKEHREIHYIALVDYLADAAHDVALRLCADSIRGALAAG